MSRDLTWLEAATIILESSDDPWMTAPELVRTIMKTGVRALRSDYGQAVRTLRSALNYEAKKLNGQFSRKDYNYNCYFALNKILEQPKPSRLNSNTTRRPSVTKTTRKKRNSTTTKSEVKVSTKVNSDPVVTNGFPSTPPTPLSPAQLLTCTRLSPLMVEIDPLFKPTRIQRQSSEPTGNSGSFCLPSPLTSLLGPRRTLLVLGESSESTTNRPIREARKRRLVKYQEDSESAPVITNGPAPATPSLPEILRLEVCHSLPSYHSDVSCVRCVPDVASKHTDAFSDDPCSAQGERISSGCFEIDPNYVYKDDTSSQTSEYSSSETDSDRNDESVHLQPTPSSQLLVRRTGRRRNTAVYYDNSQTDENSESELTESSPANSPVPARRFSTISEPPLSHRRKRGRVGRPVSRGSVSSMSSKAQVSVTASREAPNNYRDTSVGDMDKFNKAPEPRRHVSTLFLPSSPLLNENLKSVLGISSFEGLSMSQKKKLLLLLPSVDQQNGTSVPSGCFTNSFYSSALREWSERVAIGMYTPEYKARVRGEEKRKLSLKPDNFWKENYYEKHYGDSVKEKPEDSVPQPYYPYSHPSSLSSTADSLTAIINGYLDRNETPSSPTVLPPAPSPPPSLPETPPPPSLPETPPPVPQTPPKNTQIPSSTQTTPISSTKSKETKSQKSTQLKSQESPQKPKKNPVGRPPKTGVSSHKKHELPRKPPVDKQKNHVMKKPSPNSLLTKNAALPALLTAKPGKHLKISNKKSGVKRLGTSSQALVQKLLSQPSLRAGLPRDQLTRLPPKMSYQLVLGNLTQASKPNETVPSTDLQQITTYIPSSVEHKHPVFHDHFALLSREHIPTEFTNRAVSLPVSLPLELYSNCMQSKSIISEHSYARTCKSTQPGELSNNTLTLSLPRTLLETRDNCMCDKQPLVFCSQCRSLYHSTCTDTSLCPTCLIISQQN